MLFFAILSITKGKENTGMRFFIEWIDNFEGWTYSENVSVNELLDRQLDNTLTITFVGIIDKNYNIGEDLPNLHKIAS